MPLRAFIAGLRDALDQGAQPHMDGQSRDQKRKWLEAFLHDCGYDHLNRDERGVVRRYVQAVTGYSRAQMTRYIGLLVPQQVRVVHEHVRGIGRFYGVVGLTSLMLLGIIVSIPRVLPARDSLAFLNAERTVSSDSSSSARSIVVRSLTGGAGQGQALFAMEEIPVQHAGQPALDIVAVSVPASLRARVEARKAVRLLQLSSPIGGRGEQLVDPGHSAGLALFDALGQGLEGQILMVKNGKIVWSHPNFSGTGRMPTQIRRGTGEQGLDESPRRGGGGGGGGESTSTTTTITQTIDSDEWTDATGVVYLTTITDSVGIGTTSPETKLEVIGTMSGTALTLSGLQNCDTIDTDASGNLVCGSDDGGGGSGSFGSGNVITIGDSRYVNVSGDTMTGTLVIQNGSTHSPTGTALLNVRGVASGTTIYANTSLRSSGSFVFEGAGSGNSLYIAQSIQGVGLTDCDLATQTLAWDATTGRFSCGTDSDTTYSAGQGLGLNGTVFSLNSSITGALLEFTTVSGTTVYGQQSVRSSGSLVWEGAASGATLVVSGQFSGAGLTDCDASSQNLLWDATTGRFSCGTDDTAGSGLGQSEADVRYVNQSGDTMTGALLIRVTGGSLMTLGLETENLLSGAVIRAQNTLSSSGTLVFEGAASGASLYVASSLNGAGLTDCDLSTQTLAWDATTGRFSCGTDSDTTYTAGQGLALTSTAFSLSSSISGSLLEFATVSGTTVYGQQSVRSSGSLVFEGAGSGNSLYIAQSLQGVGLTDCDLSTQTLAWDATTGRFSCGTDSDTTYTAGQGLALTSTAFSLSPSHSGSIIWATNTLRSSGSLIWEGAASGATIYIGGSLQGVGLSDCDTAATSKLLWDATTGRFSCGTDQSGSSSFGSGNVITIGDGRYVNVSGDTMTGALVINVTGGNDNTVGLEVINTISGSIVHANTLLRSSGALVVEGLTTLAAGNVTVTADGTSVFNENGADVDFRIESDLDTQALFLDSGNNRLFVRADGDATFMPALSAATVLVVGDVQGGDNNLTIMAENERTAALNFGDGSDEDAGYIAYSNSLDTMSLAAGTNPVVFLTSSTVVVNEDSDDVDFRIESANVANAFVIDAGNDDILIGSTALASAEVSFSLDLSGLLTGVIFNDQSRDADIRFEGDNNANLLFLDAGADRVGIGTNAPDTTLEVVGTASGRVIYGQQSVRSSGSLIWEGAGSGNSLYIAQSLQGVGLSDCDTAATSKLLWDATTGRFSCGTDQSGGSSGIVDHYVLASGDTMTGALVINVTGGNNSTVGLNVLNTISGSVIRAQKTLASSGSLTWEGAGSGNSLYIAQSIQGAGLSDCDTAATSKLLWDATTGRFSCGTDQGGGATLVEKEADETVTSSSTLQNDDHLKFAMSANTAYFVEVEARATTATPDAEMEFDNGGFKYSFSHPAGATMRMISQNVYDDMGVPTYTDCYFHTSNGQSCNAIASMNTAFDALITAHGLVQTAGTAGDFQLTWAQFESDPEGATMKKNSVLRYTALAGTADLAEVYYTNDPMLLPGDVVAIDPTLKNGVQKATLGNARSVLGIVSTKPALLMGGGPAVGYPVPIALAGRVPVRISTENGPIRPGDQLASSSVAGVARKASPGDMIVGQALESFDGVGIGEVTTFIKNFESNAFEVLTGTGSIPTTLKTDRSVVFTAADEENRALMVLDSEETDGSQDLLKIVSDVGSDENTVFRINASGAVFSDESYNSAGADYAEWFMSSSGDLKQGEVVCIDVTRPNTVRRCDRDGDSNVMGIVSTNPAFIGNSISGADGIIPPGYVLVGLIGQVPAHVIVEGDDPIRPGDSLTAASIPGYARKAKAGESTVGVALEGIESGEGVINVLISRRNQSLTVEAVEDRILESIAAMEIGDEVEIMVAGALQDLNVDQSIVDEVTRQVESLNMQEQVEVEVARQVEGLRDELLSLTQSGSTGSVAQTTQGGGHIEAASMSLLTTLTVGSDARIVGDLSIDGSLMTEHLFVPGGIDIDGHLDASTLEVQSGAVVNGSLTIQGRLVLGSGATLEFGSGLTLADLVVERSLAVLGDVTIEGFAQFLGDVAIEGELVVSRQAGHLRVPLGMTGATFIFDPPFQGLPIVTASPNKPVLYAVNIATSTGFSITLADRAETDITFSWVALIVPQGGLMADITADAGLTFPVDSNGLPVSSSLQWNACIRGIPLYDHTGVPFTCSRYHDGNIWYHPDLGISFLWNDAVTPPYVQLPEGYVATVTEDAQNVRNAIIDMNAMQAGGDTVTEIAPEPVMTEPASESSVSSVSSESSVSSVSSESSASSESSMSSESSASSEEIPVEPMPEEIPPAEIPAPEPAAPVVEPPLEETPVETPVEPEPSAPALEFLE